MYKNKSKIINQIMEDKCTLCEIGIGKSVITLIDENNNIIEEHFTHTEQKFKDYKWKDGVIHLCKSCYDDLKSMRKPTGYLRDQLDVKKRRKSE